MLVVMGVATWFCGRTSTMAAELAAAKRGMMAGTLAAGVGSITILEEYSNDCVVNAQDRSMATVNLDDAKTHLPELILGLNPGEELVIVQEGQPLATLTRAGSKQWPCKAGSAKNHQHWMAPDFDAPLEDFREYME